jgi:hypothetical protein
MPDRRSLTVIGFIYGAVTAAVMLVACVVFTSHMAGRVNIDSAVATPVLGPTSH